MKITSLLRLLAIVILGFPTVTNAQTKWMNPMDSDEPYICGRAWNKEMGKSFNRLPDRFKATVSEKVWGNSTLTAGLTVRFATTSRNISVKYVCASQNFGTLNLSGIVHSGVDLYGKAKDGKLHWIANHMNWRHVGDTMTISFPDLTVPTARGTEYTLYLPNYNGVKWLAVGVDSKSDFQFIHQSKERPIVVYGSSIIHGASPSRPGMSIPNIVSREMGYPLINLGFSGSAYMEPGIFDMLGEIDARLFVLDPIPNSVNLTEGEIISRAVAGVKKLRSLSKAPILLNECHPIPDSIFRANVAERYTRANKAFRQAYLQLKATGINNLYYMHSNEINMSEDDMIEGTHPNDTGCRAYAEAYKRKIREILSKWKK